jgi:hypothetical protein
MKMMIRTVITKALLIASVVSSVAFAHQSHDTISSETALNIANKSLKQLTFKDLGFEVGKLDASWKLLSDSNLRVIQTLDKTFIISATNATNATNATKATDTPSKNVIYFEIAKNGKVLGVKESKDSNE